MIQKVPKLGFGETKGMKRVRQTHIRTSDDEEVPKIWLLYVHQERMKPTLQMNQENWMKLGWYTAILAVSSG